MLMIQEQYWSNYMKTSPTHHAWMLYEPTGTPPDNLDSEEQQQPRSAIYVNRRIFAAAQITQLPIPSPDITAIQINTGEMRPSVFINVYNPNDNSALPPLCQYLEANPLIHRHCELMIMAGDFNCHHPLWNPPQYTRHDEEGDNLVELAADAGLSLLIPPGTITFPNAETAIDLVWANQTATSRMIKCGIADDLDHGSDHLPIETKLSGNMEPTQSERPSFNYNKTDWNKFKETLQQHLPAIPGTDALRSPTAIDAFIEQLTETLTNAIEQSTPYKKPSPHSKPWWNPEIAELRHQQNRARNLYRCTRSPIDLTAWEEKAKEYSEGILKAQRQTWKVYVENADGKSIYQIKKYALRTNIGISNIIPTLDGHATTHEEKLDTLAKTFFPPPPPADLTDIPNQTQWQYPTPAPYEPTITIEQIQTAIRKTSPKKTPGPDRISNRVLQKALPLIECHLQTLMQATLNLGYFPKSLKTSTTIVLRKPTKRDYTKAKAYRPIALENTLGKILESIIATTISYLTETHNLLPEGHYGARPGRNTEDAMLNLSERIHHSWKQGEIYTALFLDVAGAFNNVHHKRLIHNLRTRKIPTSIALWIQSFLTDRTTHLQFNGATSQEISVPAGIPQGSPLSPLLYLYYNADALDVAESKEKDKLAMGFVDDIVYGVSGSTDEENVEELGGILEKAEKWRKRHGVQFETSKYVLVHFTRNYRASTTAAITVGETVIKPSAEAKYLGVIFDNKLRYKCHIQHAVKKGTRAALALAGIANCKWGTPHNLVRRLFQSVIAPRMDYGAIIWHRPLANGSTAQSMQMKKFTTVQRIAMKTILGCFRTTATMAMTIESDLVPAWIRLQTKIQTSLTRMQALNSNHPIHEFIDEGLRTRTAAVKHRTNIENILQQFEITTVGRLKLIAPFTRPPWRPTDPDLNQYEATENDKQNAYREKQARIKQIKQAAQAQWNDLKLNAPPSQLKRILRRNGNESGLVLYNKLSRNTSGKIIQLRTGHCGLNSYLHRFGIAESPACECGTGQETVEHFLLECPRYRNQRTEMRRKAGTGNMRVDVLLGSSKAILEFTEKYINDTERF